MDRTEIEKELNSILKYANMVHKDDVDCISVELLQSIMDLILKQEAEIERLKNANSELVDNLVFYKDKSYKLERNVDELKTEIKQEVKQAQIDVLNRAKSLSFYDTNYLCCYVLFDDIDNLIRRVQNVRT